MNAVTENQIRIKNRYAISEDWIIVSLGFAIILLFVFGVNLHAPTYSWKDVDELVTKIFALENLLKIAVQFFVVYMFSVLGALFTNKSIRAILKVFPILYLASVVALILAGNGAMKSLNLEAVIFSLLIGLAIGNLFSLPAWFKSVLSAELFVKIGLVLLGTSVVFSDILRAGSLGLLQALMVVLSVWYFAFWICRKLKLDEELTMMIASAVSICGVSAAIATAGAIKGDPKKLSYVISLVLVTAIPMMIFMPYIAKAMGLSEEVTGAWLGGTIDTTGAVVAAGSLVGDTALRYSTIVKLSQNVLLGIAAFVISVYWTYSQQKPDVQQNQKPSVRLLWERFPKFVIGFIVASLLFSFVIPAGIITTARDGLKNIQTLWFVLAFTSIGFETRFSDLFNRSNKKPFYAFLIAQLFNILVTLVIAYFLFR